MGPTPPYSLVTTTTTILYAICAANLYDGLGDRFHVEHVDDDQLKKLWQYTCS